METNTIIALIFSVLIAAGFTYFQYIFKAKNKSNLILFLALLRFLGFLGVLILLINPIITRKTYVVEKTPLLLVMDNSSSVSFLKSNKDALKSFQKIISNTALNEKFTIHTYRFDEDFKASKNFNFKGIQTNLDGVAKALKKTYKNKIFPTIILTDGNQTIGADYEYSFDTENSIYPIVLGDTAKVFDLKINQINVNKYAFYKNKFPVEVFVSYSGDERISTNLRIYQGEILVSNQNIKLSPNNNTEIVKLVLPTNKIGLQLYKATISSSKKEMNRFNNSKNFAIEVIDQKTDITIVTGINHPDVGALKRAIESNSQRKVKVVNPNNNNELEKNNILIFYQPNQTFKRVFEIANTAGINTFIVTGTATDFSFLNQQQEDLQFKMVNQKEDYFGMLNSNFNLFAIDAIDFESFPPLQNNFGRITAKSNVSVLLSSKIKGISTQSPLLAFVENQGKRKAFLLGENSWQWRSKSYRDNQSFQNFDVFIDKIIQFLASNTNKKSLVVEHEKFYTTGDNVTIRAQYFNKNYDFDEKARVTISVTNKQAKSVKYYDLVKGANSFEANLKGLSAGKYNFLITELNSKDSYSGNFEIIDYDIEKQFVNPDFQKLNRLANRTNGKIYLPNQTNNLINQLVEQENYKAIQKNVVVKTPLIEWNSLLIIIAAILSLEWFIRKYNGLL